MQQLTRHDYKAGTVYDFDLQAENNGKTRAEDLPANQQKALASLLRTTSIRAAAADCGLTERTLRGYLKKPEFAEAYRQERSVMFAESVASLQNVSRRAIDALDGALDAEDVDARIRAARAVLDYMLRGVETERRVRETEELAAEIEELKRELA